MNLVILSSPITRTTVRSRKDITNLSGDLIPMARPHRHYHLIRIQIRINDGSLPKCCGLIGNFSASVVSPSVMKNLDHTRVIVKHGFDWSLKHQYTLSGVSIKIDGFLKFSFCYGFTTKLITIQPLLDSATEDLFCKMKSSNYCLHPLLPPDRTPNQVLRTRGHSFQLPTCSYNFINLRKKSFVTSCLFKFLTWMCSVFLYVVFHV